MCSKIEKVNDCLRVTINESKEPYSFRIGESVLESEGVYILRKSAIAELALNENIIVGQPKVVFAQGENYVFCRSAEYGGRIEHALGEANMANLTTEIAKRYPAITADNRAYQRAILAVLGLSGKIYGDEEITPKSAPATDISNDKKTPSKTNSVNSAEITFELTSEKANTASNSTAKASSYQIPLTPEMKEKYPWLTKPEFDKYGDETKPDIYKIEQGRNKEKGWTASETLINDRTTAEWYANKSLSSNNTNFNKCIIACRKAIYNELYRSVH